MKGVASGLRATRTTTESDAVRHGSCTPESSEKPVLQLSLTVTYTRVSTSE